MDKIYKDAYDETDKIREDIKEIVNARYAKHKPKVTIGGIINYMGSRPTKKGGKIAFIKIEDASSELEFVVFNEVFEKFKHLLKIDELVFVEGEVIYDSFRDEIKVTAERIMTLDELIQDSISAVEIDFNYQQDYQQLKTIFVNDENCRTQIRINYKNGQAACKIALPESIRFNANFTNFEQLSTIVGKTGWRVLVNRL